MCPTCGAPLQLADAGRHTVCAYCGEQSVLSFRLRSVEPELETYRNATPRAELDGAVVEWLAGHGVTEQCNCPGCGGAFESDVARVIHTCVHCGAACKLESRLEPFGVDTVEPPRERTRKDFENQARRRIEHPWDIQTEQLVWRILNERDVRARLALAGMWRSWHFINHTAAHFLPYLLRHLQQDDDDVARAGSRVIGKLMCQGDPSLILPVLHACEEVLYDANGKECMLFELSLGPPVGIKTLLDVAEYAAAHQNYTYACEALAGIGVIFSRHFDDHQAMAEIVLYRMFYLTGPVLGWAMHMMRSGFHYGVEIRCVTMLRIIDEFAHDRPEVIPACRAHLSKAPRTDGEFMDRVRLMDDMTTAVGRAACAETLHWPPGHRERDYRAAVERVEPLLDDPDHWPIAEQTITKFINMAPHTPRAITELVKRRGDSLPHDIKRYYIKKEPDTPDLDTSRPYYLQPGLKNEPQGWELELIDSYRDTLIASRADDAEQRMAHRRRVEEASDSAAPLFLRDEPATIRVPDHLNTELQQARRDTARQRRQAEYTAYAAEYTRTIQAMMATLHDPATPAERKTRLAAEIAALGEDFSRRAAELLGGAD